MRKPSADKDQLEISYIADGNENGSHFRKWLKKNTKNPRKSSLLVSYKVPLLGIDSGEIQIYVCTKTCPWIFTAAVLLIAQNWKSKCLINWKDKQVMVYHYNRLSHSAKKKGSTIWMNLKSMLTEKSQGQKAFSFRTFSF